MTKKETVLIETINTIGEDGENYEINLYQDFKTHVCMCAESHAPLPGVKRAKLPNGDPVNKLNNNEYDYEIVFSGIKLKTL